MSSWRTCSGATKSRMTFLLGKRRDVKLENLLIREEEPAADGLPAQMHVCLADLGSGLDPHTAEHLYGEEGPSEAQQTPEYSPPEALLGG